jgi:hypothetical protein
MQSESSSNTKPVSAAQLAANRANAKKSCGPRNSENSRFNAVKYGLTARAAWAGENPLQNQEFFRYAWERLRPSNPLEELLVSNLLKSRLREDLFLGIERTVLTRRPVLNSAEDGQTFKFLHDPDGLAAVDQLARQITHLTLTSQRQFLALKKTSKQYQDNCPESAGSATSNEVPDLEVSAAQSKVISEAAHGKPINRGTLEDCLAESRLILPGEDAESYHSLVAGLWATLQPTNLLEGFVVGDFAQAQWRLDRALNIQTILLERSAVSASGHDCGFAFGFIHNVQRGQALETLRKYEASLNKRQEGRLALLYKLRVQDAA